MTAIFPDGFQGRYEDATPTVNRFAGKLVPLGDIKPVLESRYLVKGWLDQGAASVVYGDSNVGKTFFALDLALHVAGGASDWHGNKIAQNAGPVIYIAAEGGRGVHNRLVAFAQKNPEIYRAAEDDKFFLLSDAMNLCGTADVPNFIAEVQRVAGDPCLIVVDTLARSMGDGDENATSDMSRFVRSIDRMRDLTGAHVMVIHHSGKDTTKGARGSGALRAAVDTEIELTKSEDVVLAETRKQRDMSCDRVFAYRLPGVFIGLDEDGDKVTSCVVEQTEAVKRKGPRMTPKQHIAMQALSEAVATKGEKKTGGSYPSNRRCVPDAVWREYCGLHGLTEEPTGDTFRKAYRRVRDELHKKGVIRVFDEFIWITGDETPTNRTGQTGQDGTCPALSPVPADGTGRDTPL